MKKPQWRFVFTDGMMSSWYSIDSPEDWLKLPPSIINGEFSAIIVEEEVTKEEFRLRYPEIKI